MHTPTIEGYRYVLTIVNDCTQFTRVYLLHTKSKVTKVFLAFFSLIQTQYGIKIKHVLSDNAHELSFFDFFRKEVVIHFHPYVNRSQQNSMVERKHQHILNVARVLCF